MGIDRRAPIYGDSAEPKSIEEIYRLGWNIKPTSKGKDSVSMSIDILRRYTLHVTRKSHNLLKEFKKDDHGLDAIRYGCLMVLAKPNFGKYYIN